MAHDVLVLEQYLSRLQCLSICRKQGDGLFLETCKDVSQLYPKIKFEGMIVDNACMQVRLSNELFSFIFTILPLMTYLKTECNFTADFSFYTQDTQDILEFKKGFSGLNSECRYLLTQLCLEISQQ